MQTKMKIKTGIDLLMTVLLLLLMAYQITGQELHEWFGAGELLLFLLHNILNMKWYGNLFKGKYRLPRIIQTIVNFGVMITMLCLGFSGIVMSRHVFAALSIHGPMATARMLHLAASYWGFVLMSVHLGLHWSMILGMCRKLTGSREKPQAVTWILRVMAALLAMYGLYLFGRKDIFSYMFLKQQFGFLLPVIYRRGSQVFPHQKTLCRKMKRNKEAHDEKNPCIRCFDSRYALYAVRM